jgi:uncharacterized membrane protein HdeD (DUF308 family)
MVLTYIREIPRGLIMSAASKAIPGFTKKRLKWSIALSVLLIVAGIVAIIIPAAASIAVTVFTGWVLLLSGVIHLFYAWHSRGKGGIVWEILLGVLYIGTGAYLVWNPLLGIAVVALALAIYLIVEATLEFVLAFQLRPLEGWGWLLFDGIATLILAFLIWVAWPYGSIWILGVIVGVSMCSSGVTRLMMSLAARDLVEQPS